MNKQTYSEKLRDPRWQRKRLEILSRSNFTCEDCGKGDKTLHVHHCLYVAGREPWEYPNNELRSLCEDCHEMRAATERDCVDDFRRLMARLAPGDLGAVFFGLPSLLAMGRERDLAGWIRPYIEASVPKEE